ncbi:MAG: hypothetical protein K0S01_676 [Herbinix sp.]|jgi:peptide maturation system acyl carrier-related protein|nr:hypothetical protein [Herbinix sp.]
MENGKMENEKIVNEIFIKRINIDFEQNEELKSEKILGNKIGCPVRELVLILSDLEQCFGSDIWKDSIINNRFDTYANILGILEKTENYQ